MVLFAVFQCETYFSSLSKTNIIFFRKNKSALSGSVKYKIYYCGGRFLHIPKREVTYCFAETNFCAIRMNSQVLLLCFFSSFYAEFLYFQLKMVQLDRTADYRRQIEESFAQRPRSRSRTRAPEQHDLNTTEEYCRRMEEYFKKRSLARMRRCSPAPWQIDRGIF